MTPASLASLASNPALPAFVATAHAWGVVGVVLACIFLLICVGFVIYVLKDPQSLGFWGLAFFAFGGFCLALALGLPRLIDPQGFGLQALVCTAIRCVAGN